MVQICVPDPELFELEVLVKQIMAAQQSRKDAVAGALLETAAAEAAVTVASANIAVAAAAATLAAAGDGAGLKQTQTQQHAIQLSAIATSGAGR